MLNAKTKIEAIVGSQKEFSYSDVKGIAKKFNELTDLGQWEVAVQQFAFKGSTHLSLYLNTSDIHPTYRLIAVKTGLVKDDKALFKLKDFASNSGVEKSIIW
jgi:hypothetical protein